ncbi:MAG: hypothetical protein EON59_09275 [Alphaproteobacteria bacterium]|nr:MAG: hypothetical protein EON59_09275 [Alphaproteobacteria bacterium]
MNSVRDGSAHVFESRPELLVLTILDADQSVAHFQAQPETFALPQARRYTPDVRIDFRSGQRLYVDVKPVFRLVRDPDFDGRLSDIVAACAARDASFEVWTEAFYWDRARLRNASLLRHARRRSEPLHIDMVRVLLAGRARALVEIERELGLGIDGRFAALALCATGEAMCARDLAIGPQTIIRLARESL